MDFPTQKLDPDGPKWGQEDFLPTKANLAKVAGFRFLLGLRMRNPIEDCALRMRKRKLKPILYRWSKLIFRRNVVLSARSGLMGKS